MDTMSLVFGMLSILAVDAVIAIIIGILKIRKQQREIENLQAHMKYFEEWITEHDRNFSEEMSSHEREHSELERRIYDTIDERYKSANSYTDHKFDKSQQNKKQING